MSASSFGVARGGRGVVWFLWDFCGGFVLVLYRFCAIFGAVQVEKSAGIVYDL